MKVSARIRMNILILTLFLIFLYLFLNIRILRISGHSMTPALPENRPVVVFRGAYGIPHPFQSGYIFQWKNPDKKDIIVFYNPQDGALSVKRCIGTPGDSLILTDGRYYLNSNPLPSSPLPPAGDFKDGTIAEKWIFLIGDNARISIDSRYFGPLPMEAVIGKVLVTGRAEE